MKKQKPMKQKVYIDIHLYDENMRTIFSKQHAAADKAIHDVDKIIKQKIRN